MLRSHAPLHNDHCISWISGGWVLRWLVGFDVPLRWAIVVLWVCGSERLFCVFMTALHTYSYIVVGTQRGCHTLKLLTLVDMSIYGTQDQVAVQLVTWNSGLEMNHDKDSALRACGNLD